jgi:MFS family permease
MPRILAPRDSSAYPAPAAVYNWRVYTLALSAAMGSAMFGYDSAFIGGAITLPSFKSEFGLATASGDKLASLSANIVSTFQAGCFFGAILCYPLSENLGRKIPLILCGLLFNIGAILQLASSGKVGLIYTGRAFTGEFELDACAMNSN